MVPLARLIGRAGSAGAALLAAVHAPVGADDPDDVPVITEAEHEAAELAAILRDEAESRTPPERVSVTVGTAMAAADLVRQYRAMLPAGEDLAGEVAGHVADALDAAVAPLIAPGETVL